MNIGLALVPAIEKEIEELEKVCGPQGIRKAVPLLRDDMVEKLTTAEALNQVATAQETVVNSWKDLDGNIHMKRNRLQMLTDHWKSMLRTISELRKQDSERIVRYVIAHQMQTRASIVPDGRVILDVGAKIFVDFSYDEAEQRIRSTLKMVEECSRRLANCLEECKQNIVTSEVNLSQLHNYSVEVRDLLLQKAS